MISSPVCFLTLLVWKEEIVYKVARVRFSLCYTVCLVKYSYSKPSYACTHCLLKILWTFTYFFLFVLLMRRQFLKIKKTFAWYMAVCFLWPVIKTHTYLSFSTHEDVSKGKHFYVIMRASVSSWWSWWKWSLCGCRTDCIYDRIS